MRPLGQNTPSASRKTLDRFKYLTKGVPWLTPVALSAARLPLVFFLSSYRLWALRAGLAGLRFPIVELGRLSYSFKLLSTFDATAPQFRF